MFKKILFLGLVFYLNAGNWNADIQISPNPSPYVSDWETNPGLLTFTLTYTGNNPQNVRLHATLKRNGTQIASGESDPISFSGPDTRIYSNTNILNWSNVNYSSTLEQQIIRSGRFPDGSYSLCVAVYETQSGDTVARDCESFQMILPSPPQLLSPANNDTTIIPFPVFVWTPVAAPPGYTLTYRFKIWEIHSGQTPRQASFGIPVYTDSTENIPTMVYPVHAPMLENGKTYVWQIQVLDQAHEPFGQNNGKSNLSVFTYSTGTLPAPALGDTLPIIDNAIYLVISGLNIDDLGNSYRLNGTASLILKVFPGASTVNVNVRDLIVLKSDLSIISGSFSASNLSDGIIPQRFTGPFLKITSISYSVGSGVRAGVHLSFPSSLGLPEFDFPDAISIIERGFHGNFSKTANPGTSLFTLGSGSTRLDVNSISVHFSNPVVSLSGKMHLLDTVINYSLDTLTLRGSEISGKLKATGPLTMPLIPNQNYIFITMDSIGGTFSTSNFSLDLFGNLSLIFQKDTCGGNIQLNLSSSGVSLQNFTPQCQLPEVDLGWVKMEFRNLSLPSLSFSDGSGWNFNFSLDGRFSFPSLDSITFPWINGLSIFNGGFRIPNFTFNSSNMPTLPSFDFGGFNLKVLEFSMPEFTMPSFDLFGPGDSSGFDFGFNFEFSMPNLPASFPACIRTSSITLNNIHFKDGGMSFSLPLGMVNNCRVPLGGGVEYVIQDLGGSFTASYNNGLNVNGGLDLKGKIVLPPAFSCSNRELNLGNQTLHFSSDGLITGSIQNVIPSCPLQFGPLTIQIDSSGFVFVNDSGTQRVNMGLRGAVKLPASNGRDSVSASGFLAFELTQFKFIDGLVRIDRPFLWNLPSADPVLSIRVDSALLDTAGFHINGNGTLQLADGFSVGVNFNSLVLDLSNFTVKSGSASFTNTFAFKIDLSGGETWSAVRHGSTLNKDGVILNLPSNITLVDSGLAIRDTSVVGIKWSGTDYTVVARFSNDFLLTWTPKFGVARGKVDFEFNGSRVAWLDTAGFHPDFGGIIPIPAKLPIPDTTIAYVELKRNDSLLVHYTYIGDTLRIYTEQNKPVTVYVPALKFNNFVPNMGVEFDVKVNPTSFEFIDGEIHARPPTGMDTLFTLGGLGIPLDITAFDYINDNGVYGAMVSGKFSLPPSLDSLEIKFDSLKITNQGLSGTARVGHVYDSLGNTTYIDSVTFGSFVTFKIDGGEIKFSPFSAKFSGDIYPDLFKKDGHNYPVHFVATYGNSGFDFSFDLPDTLPVSVANFMPMNLGGNPPLALSLGDTISLEFSGVFSFPFLGDSFNISLSGLKIMSVAPYVVAPEISYPNPGQFFKLFGMQFGLKDIRKYGRNFPALGFEYTGGVFKINMSGGFVFMEDTITFTGMKVGTDGSFEFEEINLLSSPLNIIQNYWTLDTMKFTMDSLRLAGTVSLPAPFDSAGPQRYHITISYDGTVSGGGKITLIDETPAMGGNDPTEFNFFVGSLDINYLAVNLDFAHINKSGIEAVFYIYFDSNHPVKIGYNEGDSLAPGFSVDMDGDIEWGDIVVPNGSIPDIDWDVFKLTIRNVTVLHENGFGISFSGAMSLNISSVSGTIGFENFKVHSGGDIDFPSIDSADLSIANVVTIGVSSIEYIDHDTTIQVPTVSMPSGNSSGSSGTRQVQVSSSFSFGLTLNIMNYGGGGVKNFIVYTKKSDGAFGMVVDSANMNIPNVFEASFDMEYEGGQYFRFLFAGNAKIPAANNMQVTVVGKVANLPSGPSFGAFIAVSTEIDIIPRLVILSGVGGGFFYNPEESDFRLVKQKSGLTGMPFDTMSVRSSEFAIFLYAQARLVSDWVAEGRALLTVTNQEFLLDARVVLLHQNDKITGYAHLGIGFQDFYAVGNIGVDVNIASLIKGNGTFGFYVYSQSAWGVMGGVDVKLLSLLDINGEFFIGPPGFMVSGSASYGFDIWIISVKSGFEGQIWYIRDASWGAYYKAYVSAEVLGGVVSAKGWLEACLLGSPNFYLYGVAGISVSTWVYDFEGSVWAKISSDGVDGGFGRDPEMEALINEARNKSNDMEDAKNEAQQAVQNAQVAQSMLSPQEQAAIFYKVFTRQYRINGLELYRYLLQVELNHGGLQGSERTAIMWVANNIYGGSGSPYGDTTIIVERRRELESEMQKVSRYTTRVENILSRLRILVDSVSQAGLTDIGDSPVERLELGNSHLNVTIRNGRATVNSQPGFGINRAQNQSNSSNASQFERSVQETYAQLITRMNEIELAIFSINNLLSRDEVDSLFKAYTRLDIANSSYYSHSSQYIGRFLKWRRDRNFQLATRRNSIRSAVSHKTRRMQSSLMFLELGELILARKRAELMILYDGNTHDVDTALQTFSNSVSGFSAHQLLALLDSLGVEVWYNIPHQGLAYMDSIFKAYRDSIARRYIQSADSIRVPHKRVTEAFDDIYDVTVELGEVLYDLYDRFLFWLSGGSSLFPDTGGINIGQNGIRFNQNYYQYNFQQGTSQSTSTGMTGNVRNFVYRPVVTGNVGGHMMINGTTVNLKRLPVKLPNLSSYDDGINTFLARIDTLGKLLTPPRITSVTVRTKNMGFYNRVKVTWNITHPLGDKAIREVSYRYRNPHIFDSKQGFQSIGKPGPISRSITSSNTIGMLFPRIVLEPRISSFFVIRARAGLGLKIRRKVNFAAIFGNYMTGQENVYTSGRDTTPPLTPFVRLPRYRRKLISPNRYSQEYYTSATGELYAEWWSFDYGTGVEEYQYMVERSYRMAMIDPRTRTINWFTVTDTILNWTSAQGRRRATIRGLQLKHDSTYIISVRARNSDGYWSSPGYKTVRIDTTPPPTPQRRVVFYFGPRQINYFQAYIPPRIEAAIDTVDDPESGIAAIVYKVDTVPHYRYDGDGWNELPATTNNIVVSGDPIAYLDTFYISVLEVNNAGLFSDSAYVSGPLVPDDPTPPRNLEFTVGNFRGRNYVVEGDTLVVTLTNPAEDRETGIKDYLLGAGYTRRSASFMPFRPIDKSKIHGNTFRFVPDISRVRDGQNIYFLMVAVNNAGDTSEIASYGALRVEKSPPPPANISRVNFVPGRRFFDSYLDVVFYISSDIQSGIEHVYYRVFEPGNRTRREIVGWTEISNFNIGTNHKRLFLRNIRSGHEYILQIRVTNGAGLSSTSTSGFSGGGK